MVANEGGGTMGRVTAELLLANAGDREVAARGLMPADQVRTAVVSGIVDTGAAMLVLPEGIVNRLGVPDNGEATVRYANHRTATRRVVEQVRLELAGRTTSLIGAIVLEALDLLVDCRTQTLHPRDPDRIIAEIE